MREQDKNDFAYGTTRRLRNREGSQGGQMGVSMRVPG